MTETQVEKRLSPIRKSIQELHEELRRFQRVPEAAAPNGGIQAPGWFKRNASWFIPSVVAVVCTVCTIMGMVWQVRTPQVEQRQDEAFWLKMDKHIGDSLSRPLERIGEVEKKIEHLSGQLDGMASLRRGISRSIPDVDSRLPKLLKSAASGEETALDTLPVYLVAAREQGIRLPAESVDGVGRRLLDQYGDVLNNADIPWQAILRLLDYRSYLNLVTPVEIHRLQLMILPKSPKDSWTVDIHDSIHRIAFRDARVFYDGFSSLDIDIGTFTNCVFFMPPTSNSKKLAKAIFSERYISVSIGKISEKQVVQ